MKKLTKVIYAVLILFVLTIIIVTVFIFNSNKDSVIEINNDVDYVDEVVIEGETFNDYKELWDRNFAINNDYIGEIIFDSGLINLPFVCPSKDLNEYVIYDNYAKVVKDYDNGCESGACSLNDAYLRVDWKTMKYELGGSIFMDYRNNLYDQNLILYGHHYPSNMKDSRDLFFTPLEKLLTKDNYEANKYFKLVLNGEIRHYEIVYVYIFNTASEADYENLQFYRTNYNISYDDVNDDYYKEYINNLEKVKLYDTGISLTTNDNTVTLQTCLGYDSNGVEIVVAREIEE